MKKAKKDASPLIEDMRAVGEKIGALDEDIRELDERIRSLWLAIPNIPHPSVPFGRGEEDNPEV
ncbi:MAG: serine--tRNA ligase, partial [Candidatus Abyssubacteria bacterium]|nr:serine--tRNA ligase [Candidatus Abyssubacteria bacterium]